MGTRRGVSAPFASLCHSIRATARAERGFFFDGSPNWALAAAARASSVTPHSSLRYKLAAREFRATEDTLMDVNAKPPDFSLPDENGEQVSLKDFRGQYVVVYFFPRADTPG